MSESPEVRVATRTMYGVVPRSSTSGVIVGSVRFWPEITNITCSDVLELEVIEIGNLADDEVTVTVLPLGRVSSEPRACIVTRDAER